MRKPNSDFASIILRMSLLEESKQSLWRHIRLSKHSHACLL